MLEKLRVRARQTVARTAEISARYWKASQTRARELWINATPKQRVGAGAAAAACVIAMVALVAVNGGRHEWRLPPHVDVSSPNFQIPEGALTAEQREAMRKADEANASRRPASQ